MQAQYVTNLQKAYMSLRSKTDFCPQVLLVLGSGLGDFANKIDKVAQVSYSEIEGMPVSTVSGHVGKFVFGYVGDVRVAVMQGRIHYYEGYTSQQCVMPVRLMGMAGAKVMFVTNAAGGIKYPEIGALMRITDHISLVPSPLIGQNWDVLGKRFPDMTKPYDEQIGKIVDDTAKELDIQLGTGVYIQFSGPNYETASEVAMARTLGADAVGMSTAIEVIAARHMGIKVAGISCITNPACGITSMALDNVDEALAVERTGGKMQELIFESIKRIKDLI